MTTPSNPIPGELRLARLALDLGAASMGGRLSAAEERLINAAIKFPETPLPERVQTAGSIHEGEDPLGIQLCALRPPGTRRAVGAFYTPKGIVEPMVRWALDREPQRLIDPGCGSGRFAAAAVRRSPEIAVVAIDVDPLATLLTRATLAVLGARNCVVLLRNFTAFGLPRLSGRSAWVGNPPYVRHHELTSATKARAVKTAATLGHRASALAGLHVHFFLHSARLASPGDLLCFITASEWLGVGYGQVIRDLFLNGLGGVSLHVIDPHAAAFEDAQTTAVITCAEFGRQPSSVRLQQVDSVQELSNLSGGVTLERRRLEATRRWTPLLRLDQTATSDSLVPLSTIARVSRGVATGANSFFVLSRRRARELGVEQWCRSAITRAEEILDSGGVVRDNPARKVLLDLPKDIDLSKYPAVAAYLRYGEREGVNRRYLCTHRRPWWYVGRQDPPAIMASYMARQAPAFAFNPDGLVFVNVAHGVWPHQPLTEHQLSALVQRLNAARQSFIGFGRTYQGGLEKFEPKEMEALMVEPVA